MDGSFIQSDFIIPMKRISDLYPAQKNPVQEKSGAAEGLPFANFFKDAMQNVVETDKQVAMDVQAISTGQADDLHNLTINQTRAQIAVDLMVQIRNRLMESYSEIMRINI